MITALKTKSDQVGIFSSALCIVHCAATPLLLFALPGTLLTHQVNQEWWGWLDLLFLSISFLAVYRAVRQSSFKWVRIGLILSIILLTFFILNERFFGIEFPIDMVYLPALALVVLHLINLRKYRIESDRCEIHHVEIK